MSEAKFLLDRLTEHSIPLREFNFDGLVDQIEEYNFLLEEADALGIEWEENNYDVVYLKQSIEEAREEERRVASEHNRDYYDSIRV